MAERKFEEVCYKHDNIDETIEAQTVIDAYADNANNAERDYNGNIFCDECKQSHLTYNSGSSRQQPYLKAKDEKEHDDNCSKKYGLASRKAIKRLFDSPTLEEVEFISHRLSVILAKKLKGDKINENPYIVKCNGDRITSHRIERVANNDIQDIRSLPLKSITAPFRDDDFNCWKILYGRVKLEWNIVDDNNNDNDNEDKLVNKQSFVRFFTINKEAKHCFTLNLSKSVISHLDKDILKIDIAYITLATEIYSKQANSAPKSSLRRSEFLRIEPIQK